MRISRPGIARIDPGLDTQLGLAGESFGVKPMGVMWDQNSTFSCG